MEITPFQTHVGELSEYLIKTIKDAKVTQNVFVEHVTETVDEAPDDFVLITYPLTLRDKGALQDHDIRIEVVCKDLKTRRANIKGIEKMVNLLIANVKSNGRFTIGKPYVRLKGADGFGHTSWTLQMDCIVNTTDRY